MDEVKLVHPDDPEKKVVVTTDSQQVEAYKKYGFVEEGSLNESAKALEAGDADTSEELAKLKAENKALKTENTKLKNKLEKLSKETTDPSESEQKDVKQPGTPVGDKASKNEEETN